MKDMIEGSAVVPYAPRIGSLREGWVLPGGERTTSSVRAANVVAAINANAAAWNREKKRAA